MVCAHRKTNIINQGWQVSAKFPAQLLGTFGKRNATLTTLSLTALSTAPPTLKMFIERVQGSMIPAPLGFH